MDIPADDACCPACHLPFIAFPGTEDTDCIEIEVSAYIRRQKRKRYRPACKCNKAPGIITAPMSPRLLPRNDLGVSVWVDVLLDKYLYAEVVEGKTGHRWWLWIVISNAVTYYYIAPGRGADVPKAHFSDLDAAILQAIFICDRFSSYKKMARDMIVFMLAFCWAHVRRFTPATEPAEPVLLPVHSLPPISFQRVDKTTTRQWNEYIHRLSKRIASQAPATELRLSVSII